MRLLLRGVIAFGVITLGVSVPPHVVAGDRSNVPLRRPVAVASLGPWTLTANRDAGTVSVVDIERGVIVDELSLRGRPVALWAFDADQRVVVADFERHELVWLEKDSERLAIRDRWPVARFPVALRASSTGQQFAASSLWSWTVTLWRRTGQRDAPGEFSAADARRVLLPFAPRHLEFSPDERHLVVADAFGGRLAVVDCEAARIASLHEIDGHNIGGLATSHDGRQLLIAHQNLQSDKSSTDDNVFWGALINNGLESWPWADLLRKRSSEAGEPVVERLERGDFLPLGEPGHGTGDPQAPWIGPQGRTVVCLAGTNELAVRANARQPTRRVAVGRRPVALALDKSGDCLAVANQFDDSLTIVHLATLSVTKTISLGAMRPWSTAEEGERLFYDARLSLDGWFSCHSCHVDGHTNHRLNDNLGDDTYGAPKRVLSLLGVAESGPWQWNGSQSTLHGQIRKSMQMTMRGGAVAEDDPRVTALEDYLRTLTPPPSVSVARASSPTATDEAAVLATQVAAARGKRLFEKYGCLDCHSPPTYTSRETWDVGLADERGNRRFNPPSLRGVSQRAPYFHDNRAATLQDVFRRFRHVSVEWSDDELRDLLEFLSTL